MAIEPSISSDDRTGQEESLVGSSDWGALARLRGRVESAIAEIERLRSENTALARRVIELESDEGGDEAGQSFSFDVSESDEELREKVQGFIDLVDELLDEDLPQSREGE